MSATAIYRQLRNMSHFRVATRPARFTSWRLQSCHYLFKLTHLLRSQCVYFRQYHINIQTIAVNRAIVALVVASIERDPVTPSFGLGKGSWYLRVEKNPLTVGHSVGGIRKCLKGKKRVGPDLSQVPPRVERRSEVDLQSVLNFTWTAVDGSLTEVLDTICREVIGDGVDRVPSTTGVE
jgi:hypothetical protein